MTFRMHASAVLVLILLASAVRSAIADEGMWVFNNLPLAKLKQHYGFTPPPGWIVQLRSSAVRFNNGGSGSFVSADGLIMTNHHVGADTLSKLSTQAKDYYRDGFFATDYAHEAKAPDLELNVLADIRDVTKEVEEGVSDQMTPAQANDARKANMARIEKKSNDETGLRGDVVTLYQGGQYHLYTYKKYTDVRLVFAPEFDAAFFGGDPDNFEFPRYDLDVCFFRAYENDRPVRVEHHLKWSPDGSKEGDLVFVAGHPGRTRRLSTHASLEMFRDHALPWLVRYLKSKESFLLDYAKRGPEAFRQAKEDLFSVQNSRKARIGGLGGLNDREFMARKKAAEDRLRAESAKNPHISKETKSAWDRIAAAQRVAAENYPAYQLLERGYAFDSELYRIARILVRLSQESQKPNDERLPEYRESALQSLKLGLFSEAPIYPEFEKAKLAYSLSEWKCQRPDDPLLTQVLGDKTPERLAQELIDGTKLGEVSVRRGLAESGAAGVADSADPMIKFARAVDPTARKIRKRQEDEVEGVESPLYGLISKAIFALEGDSVYPDATFTLRLAFGEVKGYSVGGRTVAPFTTIGGAFDHAKSHGDKPPYQLPKSWFAARDNGTLKLDTPLNFVSTADIIGGNSGSPVVDRENRIVGLIFDGNIESLVLDFGYDDKVARAVSVDSRAILEALRSIYKADRLVKELTGP